VTYVSNEHGKSLVKANAGTFTPNLLGRVTVRPRCFDQQTARVAVTHLRDTAQPAFLAG
jgi:hypothetical protein